jgi:hypothetical protein
VPTQPEADVEHEVVHRVVQDLHQAWLSGYDLAWQAWQQATPGFRSDVTKALDRWMPALSPGALPVGLDPEALRVQMLNVAGRRGRDPSPFLRRLLDVDPPRIEGGWRAGLGWMPPKGSPQVAWDDVVTGLIGGPRWHLIVGAWSTLTPAFRRMIERNTADEGPPPGSLADPAGLAWLDRVARHPCPTAKELLIAYRDLPADAATALGWTLLDQHTAWRAASLIPTSGCVQKIDGVVPDILARLAGFHGPFDAGFLDRLKDVDINYPWGIFRRKASDAEGDTADTGDDGSQEDYLREGVALIRTVEALTDAPPARAAHGELLRLEGTADTLLVLLDIDLARPEMAFLELKGSRLRVCDWAEHIGELCYTRVDLDGGVKLWGEIKPPDVPPSYRGPTEPYIPDRPLLSPREGTRESGGLGAGSRLGGIPAWEQDPEVPNSPVDDRPMTFLGQFPHPDGGTAYAFLDYRHLIATVVTQWD